MPRPGDIASCNFPSHTINILFRKLFTQIFESVLVSLQRQTPVQKNLFRTRWIFIKHLGMPMLSWGPNGNCYKKSSAILGRNAVGELLIDIIQEKDELDIFWLISYPARWHLKIKKTQKMQRTAIYATSHCSRTKVNTTIFQQVHTEGNFILYYNIQYRLRKMVPVVCHNLEHFDASG